MGKAKVEKLCSTPLPNLFSIAGLAGLDLAAATGAAGAAASGAAACTVAAVVSMERKSGTCHGCGWRRLVVLN